MRLRYLRRSQLRGEANNTQENIFYEGWHARFSCRSLEQEFEFIEHVSVVRVASGSVSLGQEMIVDERSQQAGASPIKKKHSLLCPNATFSLHQNKEYSQWHHEDFFESNHSQNNQRLEFHQ